LAVEETRTIFTTLMTSFHTVAWVRFRCVDYLADPLEVDFNDVALPVGLYGIENNLIFK
jgi:hypothetical protein